MPLAIIDNITPFIDMAASPFSPIDTPLYASFLAATLIFRRQFHFITPHTPINIRLLIIDASYIPLPNIFYDTFSLADIS
jgi:hypothetical protein